MNLTSGQDMWRNDTGLVAALLQRDGPLMLWFKYPHRLAARPGCPYEDQYPGATATWRGCPWCKAAYRRQTGVNQ